MLPSDHLLVTSRLAAVGRAWPRKHIRGSASCLVTYSDHLLVTSRLATVGRAWPRKHIRGSANCLVT
jgi:hypothetical protein